ncbi:ATP synthase protein I [Desulfobaculum xiamenense]|uniref:ATP synthase protein I n=1 Tax=Desulfobaculum xiamenense TaxID=995050 RepID=A0A846QGY6_9BACT|nr:ATP synthase protein I [Desulfobaculum xiamenense]
MTHKFAGDVDRQERRRLHGRRDNRPELLRGLGMFGLVGWAVAVPVLAGAFIGLWIDLSRPGRYSWTLMLLALGLFVGCAHAAYWVGRERRSILRDKEERDHGTH